MKVLSCLILGLLVAVSAGATGKKKPPTPVPAEVLLSSLASSDPASALQTNVRVGSPLRIPAQSLIVVYQNGVQLSLDDIPGKIDRKQPYCMIHMSEMSSKDRTLDKDREIEIDSVENEHGMIFMWAFGDEQVDPDVIAVECVPQGFAEGTPIPLKVEDLERAFGNKVELVLRQK